MLLDTSGLLAYHLVREAEDEEAVTSFESQDRKLT